MADSRAVLAACLLLAREAFEAGDGEIPEEDVRNSALSKDSQRAIGVAPE